MYMDQNVYQMDTKVDMNHLAHEAFTQFSSVLTESTQITNLAGFITLTRNKILVFEKSWGVERRTKKDKIDAMTD